MEKNLIYYFSGTGNTLWAARKIAAAIGSCELRNIATCKDEEKIEASSVGIFFPVYYWGLPNIIQKWAQTVRIETPYLYELHNMGGYDGVATRQLSECLAKHGQELSASYRIKMPNNIALISKSNLLTDVYRIPGEREIAHLDQVAEKKLAEYAQMILRKETHIQKEPILYRPWRGYAYRLNAKNCTEFASRGKQMGATLGDTCIGCGQCSRVCPMGNISIKDGKPVWGDQCEFCLACLHTCPKEAINYGYSQGKTRYRSKMSVDKLLSNEENK